MALRFVLSSHFIGTQFLHSFPRGSILVAITIPVILASIKKVLHLIVLDHRFATFCGVATAIVK